MFLVVTLVVRNFEMMMQKKGESEMKQMTLTIERSDLFEKLCSLEYLLEGFKAVKRNRGSPGVDGVTVDEFGCCLEVELMQLREALF
jgi:RNA-directed DNA polymerase